MYLVYIMAFKRFTFYSQRSTTALSFIPSTMNLSKFYNKGDIVKYLKLGRCTILYQDCLFEDKELNKVEALKYVRDFSIQVGCFVNIISISLHKVIYTRKL